MILQMLLDNGRLAGRVPSAGILGGDDGVGVNQAGVTWGCALALSGQFRRALDYLGKRTLRGGTVTDRVEAAVCQAWCEDMLGRPRAGPAAAEDLTRSHDLSDGHRAVLLGTRIASALRTGPQVSQDDASILEGLLGAVPPVTRGWLSAVLAMAALGQPYAKPMSAGVQATHAALLLDEATDDTVARRLDGLVWLAEVELGLDRVGAAERHGLRGLTIAQERGFNPHSVVLAALLARHSRTTGDTDSATKYADVAELAATETDSDHLVGLAERARSAAGRGSDIDATVDGNEKLLDALSRREEEIAVLISQGCTNQRIARALSISQKTVETHLGRIFRKLMVSSRAEVAFVVGCSVRR